MKDAPRIKGYNAGKYGMPSKPLKSYSVPEKMEYLEGYSVGAWERRNDVAARRPDSPMDMSKSKEERAIEREHVAAVRDKKNPTRLVYCLHIQKFKGPLMTWNGERFTNNKPFKHFSRADTGQRKGKELLKQFPILKEYRMWVGSAFADPKAGHGKKQRAMRGGTKSNPAKRDNAALDMAAKKLEDFSGHPVSHLESGYSRSNQNTGLIVGELDLVGYRAKRDGKTERYGHHFKKNSRPLLAVTSDGKQLHIVGGQYEFTEAGIEDR